MTDAGNTRSARTRLTRARIVSAARDVFIDTGYRAASLREVAVAAGISHPGLLKHFATKDLLLAAVVRTFEDDNEQTFLAEAESLEPGTLRFVDIARRNAGRPGYLALFAALVGEG